MKKGDLVRCRYSGAIMTITSSENDMGYVDVYSFKEKKDWHMPKEHLEVINESR